MSVAVPLARPDAPLLDARLVQWMAVQVLQDRSARLVEGGADADAQKVELATIFVDLPLQTHDVRYRTPHQPIQAMPQLMGTHRLSDSFEPMYWLVDPSGQWRAYSPRILLVGGPGSGKSTLTTMVAQALRLPWIERQVDALPVELRETWQQASVPLRQLVEDSKWAVTFEILPIRVNLPMFARWLGSRTWTKLPSLWDYLASRMRDDLAREDIACDVDAGDLQGWIETAASIYWIVDGLDEVPPSAGRKQVVEIVRAATCATARHTDGLLVSTRPQGYGGEFEDLAEHELIALPNDLAQRYAERLLRAWSGRGKRAQLDEQLEHLRTELTKPAASALLHSPLHTTMAALLVANQGQLPNARSLLFRDYFATMLRRELNKPIAHGIRPEDEGVLRALHERAGLTLHVRSQQGASARPTLRRKELRKMLAAYYAEKRCSDAEVRANVERIMPFAMDRLVLLLHASEGEFEFGVRSLQEYFAAEALANDEIPVLKKRLEVVAASPHWSNVLRLIASRCVLENEKRAKRIAETLVSMCRDLNDGTIGGEAAKRCFAGSMLANGILQETQAYGHPDLHDPLWQITLEGASSPIVDVGELAANWPKGDKGNAYRAAVLRLAEAQFEVGGEARLQGWRLLNGMLLADVEEAVALADRYAPTTEEDAQAMVGALLVGRDRVLPWAARFVERNVQWFPPGSFTWSLKTETPPLCHVYGRSLLSEANRGDSRILIHSIDDLFRWVVPTIPRHPQWASLAERTPDSSPTWALWKRVATFMASPSPDVLADVLEATNTDSLFKQLQGWRFALPWPIATCLAHVRTHVELPALAALARSGDLGTVNDWRAAEARWESSPKVSWEELEAALLAPIPWRPDIALTGIVFPVSCGWGRDDRGGLVSDLKSRFFKLADDHPEALHRLLQYLALLQDDGGAEEFPVHLASWVDKNPAFGKQSFLASPLSLAPDLSGPNNGEWFALFDARGRTGSNVSGYFQNVPTTLRARAKANIAALIERIGVRPDQWGLLDALLALLFAVPNADRSALRLPDLPPETPPRAHALHAFFALLASNTEAVLFERLVFADAGTTQDFRPTLASLLRRRTVMPVETRQSLRIGALDAMPPPPLDVRNALLQAISTDFRASIRPSFLTRAAWTEHELPEPCLVEQTAVTQPAPRIVRFVELRNIRIFKETPTVDEPFPVPPGDKGQCIVLVGQNGVGKTTLLRAIALAVVPPAIASKLLDESLPLLANGTNGGEGAITIELDTGLLSVAIRRDDRTEVVEARSKHDVVRPWIVGYGVKRGNARGEKDRPAEVGPIGELHTLFDRPASLYNAAQWLENLEADLLREQKRAPQPSDGSPRGRAGIWQAVVHVLRELLGIQDVSVEPGGVVYVQHPDFGYVRLDDLSDGYLTTAGWIIDMIARWVDRQQELDEPVGADVLRQMTGLVLIDEIDLHLHPIWQMRIIDDVRRLFPNLSFVVTTHNPLVLQGARRGEVYVMRREKDGRIELVQKDIRPGQDVDRVLLEQFGVEHTFDKDTRDLLARHREALTRGARRDDPQRMALEAQIGERFGSFGDTLRKDRDAIMGPIAPLSDEERDALLAEMQRLVDEKN